MGLIDIVKFSKYYQDYKIASREWKCYFKELLEEIPNIDSSTKDFLKTRKMSPTKVLLPITLFDMLAPDKKKSDAITNTMLYILFVRSIDDLIDEKYLNKNSVKILEDFYNYVQNPSNSVFVNYNKKNLVISVAYILKKSYEMIPKNEKKRYIKFGEDIIEIEKLEFSENKEDIIKGRLEVCGKYIKGIYEIVSMHTGVENEEVAQAMYYLGLASRFYDDASDKDYPKNSLLDKKELIKKGKEHMELANNSIKTNREKSIFQGLTSLLEVWWYLERNIRN